MQRPLPWFWIVLAALLLLLPGPAGRLLLDLVGGLTLTLLLLPLLAGGAAWIGWQILRSRLRTCDVCGVSSFAAETCPACGAPRSEPPGGGNPFDRSVSVDPREATITIEAEEVDAAVDPSAAGTKPPASDS
ncbi:MAG: hypothetical protein WCF98_11115 [Synechococcus sp. ELA057]